MIQNFRHTTDWILNNTKKSDSPTNLIERIHHAQGIKISTEEAKQILKAYSVEEQDGLYNPYKLPFKLFADIMENYISVYWSGMNHSADFVLLNLFGVETEALPQLIKNTDLHNYMLKAAGVTMPG